jgi:hypothetical protein
MISCRTESIDKENPSDFRVAQNSESFGRPETGGFRAARKCQEFSIPDHTKSIDFVVSEISDIHLCSMIIP